MHDEIRNPQPVMTADLNPPKSRMTYGKKLLLAGLIFPTILLIVAAVYITARAPQIQLIERIQFSNRGFRSITMMLDMPWMDQPEVVQIVPRQVMVMELGQAADAPDALEIDWRFRYFGDVTRIKADRGIRITREELDVIATMKKLTHLQIEVGPDVTEQDIARFAGHPSLESIWILGLPKLTDHGTELFSQIPNLKGLWLEPTDEITQVGFDHIRNLDLECLHLDGAALTDADLNVLDEFTHLTHLSLPLHISDEAIEKLQAQLPNARITRGAPRP